MHKEPHNSERIRYSFYAGKIDGKVIPVSNDKNVLERDIMVHKKVKLTIETQRKGRGLRCTSSGREESRIFPSGCRGLGSLPKGSMAFPRRTAGEAVQSNARPTVCHA